MFAGSCASRKATHVAAHHLEQRVGIHVLDALGGDEQPEPMRELDRRANDHGVTVAGREVGHEHHVELELARGQLLEVS